MFPENRVFRANDADFPTTKAVQDQLRRAGRLIDAHTAPARPAPPPAAEGDDAPAGSFLLGADAGAKRATPLHVSMQRLMAGRCLVQGSSGAGKSWALRRIVEQASRFVSVIIVDPEGDFANLASHIGALTIHGAEFAADGLTATALAARRHRLNIHLDLTDLEPDARIAKAAAFFAGLLASPREEWINTFLIAIDEAHLLAPHPGATHENLGHN